MGPKLLFMEQLLENCYSHYYGYNKSLEDRKGTAGKEKNLVYRRVRGIYSKGAAFPPTYDV